MELGDELVRQIVLDDSLSRTAIVQALQKFSDMRARAAKAQVDIMGIRRKANAEIDDIKRKADAEIAALSSQVACTHQVSKAHSDPSGGSDICHECLICGAVL